MNIRNTSGTTGVSWDKTKRKWEACIGVKSKTIHLGLFINIEDAKEARISAEVKYGFHENHGREKWTSNL